jgi:phosphatidylserine decarboxylase
MRIARAGLPFIIPAVLLTVAVAVFASLPWAVIPTVFTAWLLWFFRDPDRQAPDGDGLLLAPGDGRVMAVDEGGPDGPSLAIFLGLFDVHVNRSPCAGEVKRVEFRSGRFRAAFREDAADVNEQVRVQVDTDRGLVNIRLVVGVAARRIEFWKEEGERLLAGERMGIMKFGSRIDLHLPMGSKLQVEPGDRVRAGVSILGCLPGAALPDGMDTKEPGP